MSKQRICCKFVTANLVPACPLKRWRQRVTIFAVRITTDAGAGWWLFCEGKNNCRQREILIVIDSPYPTLPPAPAPAPAPSRRLSAEALRTRVEGKGGRQRLRKRGGESAVTGY